MRLQTTQSFFNVAQSSFSCFAMQHVQIVQGLCHGANTFATCSPVCMEDLLPHTFRKEVAHSKCHRCSSKPINFLTFSGHQSNVMVLGLLSNNPWNTQGPIAFCPVLAAAKSRKSLPANTMVDSPGNLLVLSVLCHPHQVTSSLHAMQ